MAKRKRRRRINPADNHTADLTPRCEAKDCAEFPCYGVKVPALDRRVWLCTAHWRLWRLDAMRAKTRAWQQEQERLVTIELQERMADAPLLVQLEVGG